MTPTEEFYRLALEADRVQRSEETRGDPDLEPFCLRIVELTRAHPELRAQFVEAFQMVVVDDKLGAWEIVLLCMHLLRWPEIKSWAEKQHAECIAANNWRGEPVFRQILEAFEDDWDGDESYECLRRKNQKNCGNGFR